MEPQVCAVIGADLSMLPVLLEKLSSIMEDLGFSPDEIGDAELALDETVTNIVEHGYRGNVGEITLRCFGSAGRIIIAVEDTAPKFDPLSVPPPSLGDDLDERQIGGLGVMLLRGVMDACRYEYRDGRNILTMEKIHANARSGNNT
jgi:serine/threonine-protein kinase RsbW